ncbi:fibronectin type III domain-containing protein [Pilimelia columellifera]|uniref:Fibronectin type-III domain-containing protein n=1 Tax=Pilimelia columellifera subsp. columellifera TaxID=706583 RepID=A0ABP6AT76_9ACTN
MSDPTPAKLAAADAHARRLIAGNRFGEAIALLDAAFESGTAELGPEHPGVLAVAARLAEAHRGAGDPMGARRVLEDAIGSAQRALGDEHPMLLTMTYELGLVAQELGNRHEAKRSFGLVARFGPAALGAHHPAVLDAISRHGGYGTTPQALPAAGRPTAGGGSSELAVPSREPLARPEPGLPDRGRPAEDQLAPVQLDLVQPGQYQPSQAQVNAPREDVGRAARTARAGVVIGSAAVVAAVTAVMLAGVALVRGVTPAPTTAGLASQGSQGSPAGQGNVVPTGEPPTDVTVRRADGVIVVTWSDPSDGQATYVVTGGGAEEELRLLAQLPAGAPARYTAAGFNPDRDYCFQVAAIYSTTRFGVASPVCTSDS